jgi:hypothetical protein
MKHIGEPTVKRRRGKFLRPAAGIWPLLLVGLEKPGAGRNCRGLPGIRGLSGFSRLLTKGGGKRLKGFGKAVY